jgi:intein/homing endonuclease
MGECTEDLLRVVAPSLDGDVDIGGESGYSEGNHRHSTDDHRRRRELVQGVNDGLKSFGESRLRASAHRR